MNLVAKTSNAIWDTDMTAVSILLSIACFIWFVILLLPTTTFTDPSFAAMASIAPKAVWSVTFLFTATAQIHIVLTRNINSFSKYFAAWHAVLWIFTSGTIATNSPDASIAIAGEIALAAAALWVWIKPYLLAEGLYRAGYR